MNKKIGERVTILEGTKIGNHVTIEDDVYIDFNCIIRDGTTIKKGTYIGANCILGEYELSFFKDKKSVLSSTIIGENSIIRSGNIIYSNVTIGNNFQSGHNVTIREHAIIGEHTTIGTLSDIQGSCKIGNYVRIHSNVHIGQKSLIEDFVWVFPYVVLTNDPTPPSEILKGVILESFSVVATGSVILPGIVIEGDCLVAAGAIVTKNVLEGTVVGGNPAKVISKIENIKDPENGRNVYPWRETFKRGMPWEESNYNDWYKGLMP